MISFENLPKYAYARMSEISFRFLSKSSTSKILSKISDEPELVAFQSEKSKKKSMLKVCIFLVLLLFFFRNVRLREGTIKKVCVLETIKSGDSIVNVWATQPSNKHQKETLSSISKEVTLLLRSHVINEKESRN